MRCINVTTYCLNLQQTRCTFDTVFNIKNRLGFKSLYFSSNIFLDNKIVVQIICIDQVNNNLIDK